MENKEKIEVKGISVSYKRINDEDYICLTDIAKVKNSKHSGIVIMYWLSNQSTIKYLGLWEELNNENFKVTEFGNFKIVSGENSFVLTPQEWIEKTNPMFKGIEFTTFEIE